MKDHILLSLIGRIVEDWGHAELKASTEDSLEAIRELLNPAPQAAPKKARRKSVPMTPERLEKIRANQKKAVAARRKKRQAAQLNPPLLETAETAETSEEALRARALARFQSRFQGKTPEDFGDSPNRIRAGEYWHKCLAEAARELRLEP